MNTSLTSRLKQRAVIEFLTNEGCVPKEIHARLLVQFQEKTIDISNVRRWAALAKKSELSELQISDEFRSGRPKTATTNDNIAKVESMIRDDRRITQNQIAIALDISQGAVSTIIQNLGFKKVCARWILRTEEMKQKRKDACLKFLQRYRTEKDAFLNTIVTGDETWVHHYDPETKIKSMEYRHPTSPRVKKFKMEKSARKIMLTVFWDSKGIVHHEYVEKGSTINSISYCDTLSKLKARIRRVRPEYKRFLLHHDNARPHCSRQTNAKIERLQFETVLHPPYSPDLAPSNFFCFPS